MDRRHLSDFEKFQNRSAAALWMVLVWYIAPAIVAAYFMLRWGGWLK